MASMAGAPRVRSLNVAAQEAEADARPVLVPGGNKARSGPAVARKPSPKQPQPQLRKAAEATPEKPPPAVAAAAEEQAEAEGTKKAAGGGEGTGGARKGLSSPLRSPRRTPPASRKKQQELAVPLSASCSSEPASVEPLHGRASGGRTERSGPRPVAPKRGKAAAKAAEKDADVLSEVVVVAAPVTPEAVVQGKRRCAWVTPTTDPYYVTFHDEEWGVPVHDDRSLFELLVLCGALAELSWPEILKRRQNFREIFMDFDPLAIAKINEKKLIAPGSIATSLLSEQKLRAVLENARQIIKIADEFGSFNQYCWGFLNHKPMVSKFRYPRQVPVKSPKADMISKDMLRRGFRGVGPTVVYSFMQAAGLTNDHHVSCFRFKECNAPPSPRTSDAGGVKTDSDLKTDELRTTNCSEEMNANAALSRAIDALTISQDHEEQ